MIQQVTPTISPVLVPFMGKMGTPHRNYRQTGFFSDEYRAEHLGLLGH